MINRLPRQCSDIFTWPVSEFRAKPASVERSLALRVPPAATVRKLETFRVSDSQAKTADLTAQESRLPDCRAGVAIFEATSDAKDLEKPKEPCNGIASKIRASGLQLNEKWV